MLFPHADAHDMNDCPDTKIQPLQDLLITHPMTEDRRFCYGGRGPLTVMICGAFRLDDPEFNLLGVLLPRLLHIESNGAETTAQLRLLLSCIEAELRVSQPGGEAIVTRMAEAFMLQAIRDYVLSSAENGHGLRAVLRDPALARVLSLIHQRPEHPWTVGSLADAANLSRSGFAARFKTQVGATPQRYVQRYRFSRAVELLRTTDAKIAEIAQRMGYGSESSFSKAFKRITGKTPGACRHDYM